MAKPKKIKISDIVKLGALQCTENEAAAWLGVRKHVFVNLLRKDPQVAAAWERGKNRGLISLRRKQHRLAKTNATMAIFLGKNYLKQRDLVTSEHSGPDGGPINIDYNKMTPEERSELRAIITRASRSETDP